MCLFFQLEVNSINVGFLFEQSCCAFKVISSRNKYIPTKVPIISRRTTPRNGFIECTYDED